MSSHAVAEKIVIEDQTLADVQGIKELEGSTVQILDPNGVPRNLSTSVQQLILQALESISRSGEVQIRRIPEVLTSSTAAELLGVSRPTVMKWANQGLLPSHKAGSHTRFKRKDVVAFGKKRFEQQLEAFESLQKFDRNHDDFFMD